MEKKMMEETAAYVEMKHINKTFDGFQASRDVSFGVEKAGWHLFWDPAAAERQPY